MPSILIIDDDKLVRESTRILLRNRGYTVETAADGGVGTDIAKSRDFDLVIVDLFMPGTDGIAVMKAIREAKPKLPMIVASGFMFNGACPEMPEFEAIAIEAGAMATLYKPFRPHDVLGAVERAIGAPSCAEPAA